MSAIPLQLGSMMPFGKGSEIRPNRKRNPAVAAHTIYRPEPASTVDSTSNCTRRVQREETAATAPLRTPPPVEINVDQKSDESLLDAYLGGDRGAFTALMKRYSNELLHFLTRFLGSRAAADDVFQDTFLQIHLSAETFDSERRFKPWLFTIAANKARDYHRKHSRSNAMSLSAHIGGDGEGECFVDLLEAEVPNPDMPLLDAERSRLVKRAVDSLPVHLREILLLSYFQGFSYNQIADSLEIPLGTVKSRLHTAVAAFARAWKVARGNDEGNHNLNRLRDERSHDE